MCHAAVARELPGISQPFPNIFDPLNFLGSAGSSNNPIRDVRRWRESELTHGRVCMLAALGFVVQEQLIDTKIRPFPFVKGTCVLFARSFQCFQHFNRAAHPVGSVLCIFAAVTWKC